MTTLTIHADCDAAPKRVKLRNLHIAFAQADVEGILPYSTIDIRREIVGEVDLIGMESVRMALEATQDVVTTDLAIHSDITNGTEGTVNGAITTGRGSRIAICDVYRFASASSTKTESMVFCN